MPVFTGEIFKFLQDATLCPGLVSIPAGLALSLALSLRSPGEARQVPEVAGGRDRADPTGQKTPGDDELVSVPASPSLHHLHLISETFTGWLDSAGCRSGARHQDTDYGHVDIYGKDLL